MKSWKKPTPEQVDKVFAQLAHGEHQRYFFDKLENPEWLVPLQEKGFFKSPPLPIPDESGATVALPVWPESRYLARMAKLAPQIVLEIISLIPDTENARVHDDLVEAALAMPAKLAASIVPKAISWIRSPFKLLLPEKLGALISHLALGGEVESALDLANALLAVRADPRRSQKVTEENRFPFPMPQPFFDLWHYGQILEKNVPDLVAAAVDKTLNLLSDLLDAAVRLSQRSDEGQGPDDLSYIWRSAIERPQYSVESDVRGFLVTAVRDAAEQAAQRDRAKVPEIVRDLENRTWRVFHRIALHILRLFPDAALDLVRDRLTDPERFDRPDYRREYNLLAKECFPRLEPDDQAKILDWIQKGPDIESVKAASAKYGGTALSDQQATRYVKVWQRDRLAPFSADLPEEWKQRYAQLVTELGPVEEPQTGSNPVWGWSSPKTEEELSRLTLEQLVDYLKSWAPSGTGIPFGDSIEGLGRAVGALVVSQPERFSGEAERFKGLDPTYVRALIQALWEAARQKRFIHWEKILALCHWVVDQPRELSGRKGGLTDRDPDWGWTRKAIAFLLARGFESDGIPVKARDETWYVLERLTNDPDPTPEYESESDAKKDPASFSINTTRGEAMHAVICYALWVRRNIENEPNVNLGTAQGFDQMPEVRIVLDKHLDPSAEPCIAIRAVYGQWFPSLHFLDPDWAAARMPAIFPRDEASKDLRKAAWNTYIIMCQPYDAVFGLLKEEYRQAIDRIRTSAEGNTHQGDPDLRLAQHLITQYWRGNLNDQDGLLTRFYAKADLRLRKSVIEFIGINLHNTSGAVAPEALERLKKLWTKRLDTVRAAGAAAPQMEEVRDFGWWFASRKFPDEWSIEQLSELLKITGRIEPDHLVVERLAELSEAMPAKAVECLAMIVQVDKDGWGVLSWREHAHAVLATAMHSGDETARSRARDLVHHLGARGYFEFRHLLQ